MNRKTVSALVDSQLSWEQIRRGKERIDLSMDFIEKRELLL